MFVPGHDGLLAETDVAAVEADPVLGQRAAPDFFHRLDPATRAHRVALAPFHVQAQARAANHAGQRMMARSAGLLRIVADGSIFLFAVTHHHCGIPVSHAIGWHGVVDDLLGWGEPLLDLSGIEIFAKAAKCVLTTKPFFFHAGDFGDRPIILESTAMGETRAP